MFSQATLMQEEHGGTGWGRAQISDNKLLSETIKRIAIKELRNPGNDMIPKVRKPYTMSKQRERWTEEEHKKFLEALKLHGRAWRKIEDHVGTKTAVQIRSHAQKFFSKITRESGEESTHKPIEIPPPRPKRKPVHPYPRKMITLTKPVNSIPKKLTRPLSTHTSVSDNENQYSSPTSVLSVSSNLGLTNGGNKLLVDAANSSPVEQMLELLPSNSNALARECLNKSNGQFLKLFGKTLVVNGPDMIKCNNSITFPTRSVPIRFSTDTCIKAYPQCDRVDDEKLNESSSDLSNEYREFKGQVKNLIASYRISKRVSADSSKGFVPYKRCVMEQDSASSSNSTCR